MCGRGRGPSARPLARLLLGAALLVPPLASASAQVVKPTDRRQLPGADTRDRQEADTAPVKADPNAAGTETGMDDSYKAKGVNLESFLLLPKFEVDERFNSNLFAETLAMGDFQTILRPAFVLNSRFPRHALNVTGQIEDTENLRFTQDNRLDGFIATEGRYDLGRNAFATGAFRYSATHEDRGSNNDAQGRTPTPIETLGGEFGATAHDGRYSFGVSGTATRLTYGNVVTSAGAPVANDLRDRTEATGTLRAGYELFPGYSAIVEGTANTRQYDSLLDLSGFNRSSDGYTIMAGAGVDVTSLLRGDVLVGYMEQFYQDTRFQTFDGPSVKVTLNWTPNRETLIVPSLERSINETVLAAASSFIHNAVNVLARYEARRNIILTGFVSYSYDEFPGTSSYTSTYEGDLRIAYAINRNFYIGTDVDYKNKSSDLVNRSYDQFILGIRLGSQF